MRVTTLPILGAHQNYSYIITDTVSKCAAIVDPAEPAELLGKVKDMIKAGQFRLVDLYCTHHHWDHAQGNAAFREEFKGLRVVGGRDSAAVTMTPQNGSEWSLGKLSVTAMYTPCHTQDSICYYIRDGEEGVVFTGYVPNIRSCKS